jgi:hypothetical protein
MDASAPPMDAGAKSPTSSSAGAPSAGSSSVAGSVAAGSGGISGTAAGGGAGEGAGAPSSIDAMVPDAMPAPDASTGATLPPCTKPSSYMTGSNRMMLQQQNRMRRYVVYVPNALDTMVRSPLVIDFHGNTSSAMQEQSGSR